MAKIMKANSTQSMLLEQFRKLYRQIAGLDYIPNLIYADIANVNVSMLRGRTFETALVYSNEAIPPTKGTVKLNFATALESLIIEAAVRAFEKTANRNTPIRRLGIAFSEVCDEGCAGYDLFTNFEQVEREENVQRATLDIKERFGKNALLKAVNLMPEGTQRERNEFIGGHRAGYDDPRRKS